MSHSPIIEKMNRFMEEQSYAENTRLTYTHWVKQFLRFHDKTPTNALKTQHLINFLTHISKSPSLSTTSQSLALTSLRFFYAHIIKVALGDLSTFEKIKKESTPPILLTADEIKTLFLCIPEKYRLLISFIYGSGLTRREVVRIRMGDIDKASQKVRVWDTRMVRSRRVTFSPTLLRLLDHSMALVEHHFESDQRDSHFYGNCLPAEYLKKHPNANQLLSHQYLFPNRSLSINKKTGGYYRSHIDETSISKAFLAVAKQNNMSRVITPSMLRYSFALHLLQSGVSSDNVCRRLGGLSKDTLSSFRYHLEPEKITEKDLLADLL